MCGHVSNYPKPGSCSHCTHITVVLGSTDHFSPPFFMYYDIMIIKMEARSGSDTWDYITLGRIVMKMPLSFP